MKHTFNLVYPGRATSPVRLVVSHDGEKFRRSLGVTVSTKLWNQKGRTPDKMCKDRKAWEAIGPIHAKLVEKEVRAMRRKDVLLAMSYALGEDFTPHSVGMWDYFGEWSGRDTPSRRFRQLAFKRIADIMGKRDDWDDVDGDWYFRFVREMDALGYSHNYKSTLTAKFKTMMKEAFNRGIHTNEAFRLFRTGYKTADTIALTKAEVDAIWGADLSGARARARDCFIVGIYCAGRFQDYSQLSEENLVGGNLRYVQRKTGQTVIIPCSPRIREVFARNGGRVPKITEQEVGRHMKDICKEIGGTLAETVEVRTEKGNRTVIEKKKRWQLVSCHTARRSGASILYLSGMPIRLCRFLTGHTTDQMFLNYLKVGKEEAADLLAKSDFFK